MPFETKIYSAPSRWASYLINGDSSGLDEDDLILAQEFESSLYPGYIVEVSDKSYFDGYCEASDYSVLFNFEDL